MGRRGRGRCIHRGAHATYVVTYPALVTASPHHTKPRPHTPSFLHLLIPSHHHPPPLSSPSPPRPFPSSGLPRFDMLAVILPAGVSRDDVPCARAPPVNTTHAITVVRGPYLIATNPYGFTVRWRSSAVLVGRVRVAPAPPTPEGPYDWLPSTFTSRRCPGMEQDAVVQGLQPGTQYVYQVGGTSQPCDRTHSHVAHPNTAKGPPHPSLQGGVVDPAPASRRAHIERDYALSIATSTSEGARARAMPSPLMTS